MGLRHLSLRDFVIVPELDLTLASGFSALTGETGAGKSILIDALQLVLGARGDAEWIREGAARCEIAAEFDQANAGVRAWLDEAGYSAGDGGVLIRRVIDAGGKSRAWINGSAATMAQLRALGALLVDIHGQHAWQNLTRADAVRSVLDSYADTDSVRVQTAWRAWRDAASALEDARAAQDRLGSERERLLWQIGELDKLAPEDDEWDELNQRHTRLMHAQALIDAACGAGSALESEEESAGDARSALARALEVLQAESAIEPRFEALASTLQDCDAQIADVARTLGAYARDTEIDPDQLALVNARVGQWLALARRYHRQPEDLPALLTGWRAELAQLDAAADLGRLEAALQSARTAYDQAAQAASTARRRAAPELARSVTALIRELGMEGGSFQVTFETLPAPSAHGAEDVHFLFAGHAKATPRALERVASGGELSRLALAVAVTTSAAGAAATLVFDEVDAGIGGTVANTVGALLRRLGQARQVLCVTHLAQVACHADHQLSVSKTQTPDGAVQSAVRRVAEEERVAEIARMLGGDPQAVITLAHARQMIADACSSAAPAQGSTRAARRKAAA